MIRPYFYIAILYVTLSVFACFAVHQNALRSGLETTRQDGYVRLSEAASRLRLQLDSFRSLVNYVANEPVVALALNANATDHAPVDLAQFQLTYGAWHIDLVDPTGRTIASSGPDRIGKTYSRALVVAALNQRLGTEYTVENGIRLIRFSRGVLGDNVKTLGAVIVSADMSALEFEWPVTPEPVVFFNNTMSFISNRPELLGLSLDDAPTKTPFPLALVSERHPVQIWQLGQENEQIEDVVRLHYFSTPLNLRAEIYLSIKQARETAWLQFLLALASAVVVGLAGAVAVQQHRRLALEANHSATLEARVEKRSSELRVAQNELIESSKMAAMGRLSAGISHELNQPLGAILNFAENGRKLLARNQTEPASENLFKISEQVRRITRIIGNLRAFARQEITPTNWISCGDTIQNAYDLAKEDLAAAGVKTTLELPQDPLNVLAGRVRLEQVIFNLITNAMDAMEHSDTKHLTIALTQTADHAVLRVADTGTGIEAPDRVFEPFYTTKNMGASQGLGLGLSLSFGIIQQFGGDFRCCNRNEGAEFIIELPRQKDDHA
jgi:two-component system C4-dicarboxylate transport sensor histidine kinase DctB